MQISIPEYNININVNKEEADLKNVALVYNLFLSTAYIAL